MGGGRPRLAGNAREKDEPGLHASDPEIPCWPGQPGARADSARQPKADLKTLTDGAESVLQQLKGALANHGLVEISPAGKPFDPHQHEAISHQADAKVAAEHVLTVRVPALNGRLLRPGLAAASAALSAVGGGPTMAKEDYYVLPGWSAR